MTKVLSFLVCLALAATLFNSNTYGDASLTAIFTFWILSSFASTLIFVFLFTRKIQPIPFISVPVIVYSLFCIYVFVQMSIMGIPSLSTYYWLGNCLFLISVYTLSSYIGKDSAKNFFYYAIFFLSFFEAAIVILQFSNLLPSPSKLFRCTGTWANPNISASFLALSLFALLRIKNKEQSKARKLVLYTVLLVVTVAILMLTSRTAIIIAIVLIAFEYQSKIYKLVENVNGVSKRMFFIATSILLFLIILLLAVFTKEQSSAGRLLVWRNSARLILEKPLFGYGFGQFEKEYNLYAAGQNNPLNQHVNMPYNDFLELGVQGGVVAIMLWILFIVLLVKYSIRESNKSLASILVAFLILQVTNFGFQAIPVNVLFLLYVGVETVGVNPAGNTNKTLAASRRPVLVCLILLSTIFFNKAIKLSSVFYQRNQIAKTGSGQERVNKLLKLTADLQQYASFHESVGDAFLDAGNYRSALSHFLLAQNKTSKPALFSKSGYCYQMLGEYDKSLTAYLVVQRMEPQLLAPHIALLNLYHQRRDTTNYLSEATTIVRMPVKVQNAKAVEMKRYADSVIKFTNNYFSSK